MKAWGEEVHKGWRYIKSCSIDTSWNKWTRKSDAVKVHADKGKHSTFLKNPTTTTVCCYKNFTTSENDSQVNWQIVWFVPFLLPKLWISKHFVAIIGSTEGDQSLMGCSQASQIVYCHAFGVYNISAALDMIAVSIWIKTYVDASVTSVKTCRMCISMNVTSRRNG